MISTIFLLPTIFVAYDSVTNRNTVLDNPSQVQLVVIALLASIFVIFFYLSEIYQLTRSIQNPFACLKNLSSMVVFILCIVFAIIHYVCFQPRNCLNILKIFGVALLSAFIFTLVRDIFPAIILMFAFPVDTFALLALHVALFYTETMIGTLVVCQSRKYWKTWKMWKMLRRKFKIDETTNLINLGNRRAELQNDNEETHETEMSNASEFIIVSFAKSNEPSNLPHQPKRAKVCACTFLCVLGVVTLCVTMLLFYVCMMCFFQLFILRNLDHSTAFSVMLKYVPSAAIGLFGFVVGKSTLFHNKVDKAEDAETFWIKLGDILGTDEEQLLGFDEKKRRKIRNLKRAFRTESCV